MVWARLDDSAFTHRKFLRLAPAAIGLWAMGLSYCGRELTDGFIPTEQVTRLIKCSPRVGRVLSRSLVEVRLWEPVEGGYMVHDWLDWNPSRAAVEAARARKVEAGRLGGLKRRQAWAAASAQARATAPAQAHGQHYPDPTREEDTGPSGSPRTASSRDGADGGGDGAGGGGGAQSITPVPRAWLPYPTWIFHDSCPRLEHVEKFPEHRRGQCPRHRGQS
jgi:hypothetical protein